MPDKMTREDVRALAREAGTEAAHATLVAVGIDPSDPIEAQETAAAMRKLTKHENIEALYFARRVQRTCESTRNRVAVGAGAAIFAWLSGAFDSLLKKVGLG